MFRAVASVRSTLLCALLAFAGFAQAQGLVPGDVDFENLSGANALATASTSISQTGGRNLRFYMVSPTITPAPAAYAFIGDGDGTVLSATRRAFMFNYTRSGSTVTIPGTGLGTNGDYRITFSNSDGSTLLGNFGLRSMYVAVGAGNDATVSISGHRAGEQFLGQGNEAFNLGSSFTPTSSATGLTITSQDAYNGVYIQFGSNWQFIDTIRIRVSTNFPVLVDDIDFDDPTTVAPTINASSPSISNRAGSSATLNWVNGNGDRSVVFIKQTSATESPTLTDYTSYTANTVFGSGTQVGSSGWYAVYNGQGTSVPITGLSPGTDYRVVAVSYNGNASWATYASAASAPKVNFTTVASPSTQASGVTVAPSTSNIRNATINWTNGNGAKRIVFVRSGATTGSAAPVNNTVYTANAAFGSGTQISSTGWYAVYDGTGTSVSVTNLTNTAGTNFRVHVVEYNDNGSGGGQTYNTTDATANPLTYTSPNMPTAPASAATSITLTGATLNGTVDPRNAAVTAIDFLYSSTDATLATFQTLAATPGTLLLDAGATAVAATLTGLTPSTTYYYRVRATNFVGTTSGSILNFSTGSIVASVSATTADGYYNAGDVIAVTVTFTGNVTVTGTPTLALATGGSAVYASGSGTATLTFNYTVSGGENSTDLNYTATNALALSGGTISGAGSLAAGLTLPALAASTSLASQKNIQIDTIAPTLNFVTIASNNANAAFARVGDVMTLSFTTSEPVATPWVTIAGQAATVAGAGGNNWTAAKTIAEGDPSGTAVFSINVSDLAGNTGNASTTTNASTVAVDSRPLVPTYTGVTNNADLTGPLVIAAGGTINGGKLAGAITNQGRITGTILLGLNTTIDGGTLSGTITSAPESPALITNAVLLPGTHLQHVLIGTGNTVSPQIVIGAGVRFGAESSIPAGLDLGGALNPQPWPGSSFAVPDLTRDVLGDGSILAKMQALPAGGVDTLVRSANGELVFRGQGFVGALLPARVAQGTRVPGISVDADNAGKVTFVTANGRIVETYSILVQSDLFASALATRGLAFSYDDSGNVVVTGAGAGVRYVGRAARVAVPAFRGTTPGLHVHTLQWPANVTAVSLIFVDANGVLMEQDIVSIPAAWPALRELLLADPRNNDARMGADGVVSVVIKGHQLRGRAGYLVTAGIPTGSTEAIAQPAGDLNGDGTLDYLLIFPSGERQAFYLEP